MKRVMACGFTLDGRYKTPIDPVSSGSRTWWWRAKPCFFIYLPLLSLSLYPTCLSRYVLLCGGFLWEQALFPPVRSDSSADACLHLRRSAAVGDICVKCTIQHIVYITRPHTTFVPEPSATSWTLMVCQDTCSARNVQMVFGRSGRSIFDGSFTVKCNIQ